MRSAWKMLSRVFGGRRVKVVCREDGLSPTALRIFRQDLDSMMPAVNAVFQASEKARWERIRRGETGDVSQEEIGLIAENMKKSRPIFFAGGPFWRRIHRGYGFGSHS